MQMFVSMCVCRSVRLCACVFTSVCFPVWCGACSSPACPSSERHPSCCQPHDGSREDSRPFRTPRERPENHPGGVNETASQSPHRTHERRVQDSTVGKLECPRDRAQGTKPRAVLGNMTRPFVLGVERSLCLSWPLRLSTSGPDNLRKVNPDSDNLQNPAGAVKVL